MIAAIVDTIQFPSNISGWAYAAATPSSLVKVQAYLDGRPLDARHTWGHSREFLDINGGKIGFSVDLPITISPHEIVSGQLTLTARVDGVEETSIPVWDEYLKFLNIVASFDRGEIPQNFSSKQFAETVKWLKRSRLIMSSAWYDLFLSSVNFDVRVGQLSDHPSRQQLSQIFVPAGVTSPDNSAMIIQGGQAILVEGSTRYQQSRSIIESTSAVHDWPSLVQKRRTSVRPAKYLHFTIPEKSTALGKGQGSENYRQLEHVFKDAEFYLTTLPDLQQGRMLFRKFDTHLSPEGAWRLVAAALTKVGIPSPFSPAFDREVFEVGDLSDRFFSVPAYDRLMLTDENAFHSPSLLMERDSERAGGHIGIRRHWINEEAPVNAKLFIAGNSFAGKGISQTNLNWWLSRIFREVYFDFNPALDVELCRSFEPDFVFTQTIERFLCATPLS